MKLRAPSIPIITIDPYTSIWLPSDRLNDCDTVHWTGKDMPIRVYANIKDKEYILLGSDGKTEKAEQKSIDISAMTTTAEFKAGNAEITLKFTAPMFLDDLKMLSRPVNFLSVESNLEDVIIKVSVAEEICQEKRRQAEMVIDKFCLDGGIETISMKSEQQPVLLRFGDDVRIDWGCFYLSCEGAQSDYKRIFDRGADTMYVSLSKKLENKKALFTFAYDDIKSIDYFHSKLPSFWNKDGAKIEDEIISAYRNYREIFKKSEEFSNELYSSAVSSGGDKYAQILSLAYRQVLAAHKLVVDTNGDILYISKECFSNGCAATVDVSYPSVPLFLIYNPELVKGMLRPIFKYAKSPEWPHEFAPHDVGTYPILWGQTYGGTIKDVQMPIEECGNMLIMTAAVCLAEKDYGFAEENIDLLKNWADYLVKFGADPENQLCTDDFAGHSAHNCNLSVKAIMAIEAMSLICRGLKIENSYHEKASDMAEDFKARALNPDGSLKLAFDKENSFSMKYNLVWDKVFGTDIFDKETVKNEFNSYLSKINPYGMPLDSRETYTKSDWLVWTAVLSETKEDFERFTEPLFNAYNYSKSRVPLNDWYDSVTALQCSFQHRSVQGGLYMKILCDSEKLKA